MRRGWDINVQIREEVTLTAGRMLVRGKLTSRGWKGITPEIEPIITQDYYPSPENKQPRYYQILAINRVIEAIAKGQTRILLVMATGAGKTFFPRFL